MHYLALYKISIMIDCKFVSKIRRKLTLCLCVCVLCETWKDTFFLVLPVKSKTTTEQTRLKCYPIRTFPNLICVWLRAVKLFPGAAKKWADDRHSKSVLIPKGYINLVKPTGHVMHQQFNIQQLYALPTLYLCVLYLSENKQRLVPLTA